MMETPETGTKPARGMLSRWRDPQAWLNAADVFAVLTVVSLPWSTSLMLIFAVVWVLVLLPALDLGDFVRLLGKPASYLPLALCALAMVGMLWSIGPWSYRLDALGGTLKLLTIPLIFFHFRRSPRGNWVLGAFLVSCTLLMLLSWLSAYDPRFALKKGLPAGVPVKNYIAQSQEFALCVMGLAWLTLDMIRRGRRWLAALFAAVMLGFILNMTLVVASRTALVTLPLLFAAFIVLNLKPRAVIAAGAATAIAIAALWMISPGLQNKLATIGTEFNEYQTSDAVTSGGLRLEIWRKSLLFFADAPVLGHGTGATRTLFEQSAENQTGVGAEVVGNPHNQTLSAAVQWGVVGIVVLYALWLCHLMLFLKPLPGRDLAAWIGLVAVMQNFLGSLFNSHLFDFVEGWMYVLAVGIAGGMVMAARGDVSGRGKEASR